MFGSPVPGPVLPPKAVRTTGQFIVTRTFADHIKYTPQGLGIDIGNAREGDPVYAQEAGRVTFSGPLGVRTPPQLGDGSLTVIIRYDNGWEGGYTHLSKITIKYGQRVARGTTIGAVGRTGHGITEPHLHYHNKDPQGRHQDPYPLLDQQNGANDVPSPLKTYAPALISVGGAPLVNGLVPIYDAPSKTATQVYGLTPGTGPNPPMLTTIGTVGKAGDEWYTFWDVAKGKWLYVNLTNVPIRVPLTAGQPPPDLNAAYNKGLADAKAAVAAVPPK